MSNHVNLHVHVQVHCAFTCIFSTKKNCIVQSKYSNLLLFRTQIELCEKQKYRNWPQNEDSRIIRFDTFNSQKQSK